MRNACFNSDLIILHTEWNAYHLLEFNNLFKKRNFKFFKDYSKLRVTLDYK